MDAQGDPRSLGGFPDGLGGLLAHAHPPAKGIFQRVQAHGPQIGRGVGGALVAGGIKAVAIARRAESDGGRVHNGS